MALLRRGDLSLTEACFAVGCSSLGTFNSRFTDLVVRGETGDQTGQESRSAGHRAAPSMTAVAVQLLAPTGGHP
jgi:hypothetical protein